jgi:hypothetical protein
MADNESRTPLLSTQEALLSADVAQLELPFMASGGRRAALSAAARQSRLAGRKEARRLVAPRVGRPLEEIELEHGVACHLPPGKLLDLRLTDNRYTIVSVRRGRESYQVRAHRMFAGAEPRLMRALARYVVHNDQRACALLGEFIEQNQDQIRRHMGQARRIVLRTRGRVFDLAEVYHRLNARYFDGRLDLRITWGAARQRRSQRSIKIGTYQVEDRLIRVHPLLDHEMVPRYFLDWIVFHEMLHGKHAIRRVGGRRCFHPPEFAREEQEFPDYGRARLWEKANLDKLLSGEP